MDKAKLQFALLKLAYSHYSETVNRRIRVMAMPAFLSFSCFLYIQFNFSFSYKFCIYFICFFLLLFSNIVAALRFCRNMLMMTTESKNILRNGIKQLRAVNDQDDENQFFWIWV